MLSLELVQSFVVVAEELHVGRAAERLAVTQPPLSRRIQHLERDLGVDLFLRSSRGLSLTPAGEAFLVDARRMLRLAEAATTRVRRVPTGEVGTVSVGFTATIAYSFLGRLLDRAADQLPDVQIVLREMVTDAQVQALHDGSLDLGLLRPPVRGVDLTARPVSTEALLAAVPADSALAARHQLSPADFDQLPMVMYEPVGARYFHDLVLAAFGAANVRPDFRQWVTQIHTALALVGAGVGAAIVPEAAAALHLVGVRLIPMPDLASFPAELEVCWRPERSNPARDRLVPLLYEE